MNRAEAWSVHASMLLVGGTGLIYAWMRYLAIPSDPYAVVNHPWQPALQHLHIWVAPLLVFGAGLIWKRHIWEHFRAGVRSGRKSGLALLVSLAPMVLSGYLIQTAVSPSWRTAWVVVHLITSALWILGYGGHVVAQLRRSRSRQRAAQALREAPPSWSEATGEARYGVAADQAETSPLSKPSPKRPSARARQ